MFGEIQMKNILKLVSCFTLLLFITQPLLADEIEYKGIIHARPAGTAGNWIIGDNVYKASEKTKLDEEKGPLIVGACAEVEVKNGKVTEIETESMKKCQK